MEDMMNYQYDSTDNMIGLSGLSDVQMKELYNRNGSIQTNEVCGPYSSNPADLGSCAPYDFSNVGSNELHELPFYCPYKSTGSGIHGTSLLNHCTPMEEVVSTEPYLNIKCQHIKSNSFLVQVKMEEPHKLHSFVNHEASASNPPPRRSSRAYRQRSRAAERESNRRSIIAEKMQELQELLPASSKAKKTDHIAIVDDALAYMRYLRKELMEECRRNLGYESVSAPLSLMEGYRNRYPQEPITREPAEEVFRILTENDPATAFRLLESKGLYLVPTTSVETLHCSK